MLLSRQPSSFDWQTVNTKTYSLLAIRYDYTGFCRIIAALVFGTLQELPYWEVISTHEQQGVKWIRLGVHIII